MYTVLSHVQLFVTPRTVAHWDSLSMGFSRQEHWSRLLLAPLADLPDPGTAPASTSVSCTAGEFFTAEPPGRHIEVGL